MQEQPEAGAITIRTRHAWDGRFAVDGTSDEIESGGEVTKRSYRFRTDWPPDIGGADSGPSPGEALLGALGGCVAMTYITKATLRGIDIEELEVTIDAHVDLLAPSNSLPFEPAYRRQQWPSLCDRKPMTRRLPSWGRRLVERPPSTIL